MGGVEELKICQWHKGGFQGVGNSYNLIRACLHRYIHSEELEQSVLRIYGPYNMHVTPQHLS